MPITAAFSSAPVHRMTVPRRHVDLSKPGHTGSRKASDLRRLALCLKHHNEMDQVAADFVIVHSPDIPTLIQLLNHLWELRQRRPA